MTVVTLNVSLPVNEEIISSTDPSAVSFFFHILYVPFSYSLSIENSKAYYSCLFKFSLSTEIIWIKDCHTFESLYKCTVTVDINGCYIYLKTSTYALLCNLTLVDTSLLRLMDNPHLPINDKILNSVVVLLLWRIHFLW